MRKGDKKARSEEYSASDDDMRKRRSLAGVATSDDDEEANGDLSLEIVRKSMRRGVDIDPRAHGVSEIVTDLKKRERMRKKKKKREGSEANVDSASDLNEVVVNLKEEKRKTGRKKKTKDEEIEAPFHSADKEKDDDKPEPSKALDVSDNAVETNPVEPSDNAVLRKLLRGPRYFDPPDSSWGTCYNCGEEGHTTVNCTAAKRKKPCFVCGSFEHNAKQCTKGRDCFICKQRGHRAKDCSEKYKSSKICLKCGDPGHDMFSCRNDYDPDDLKEIQCYVCGRLGHLCCRNNSDAGPLVLSCYRCGQAGHTGLACTWQLGDRSDAVSANSCYKCGLEGHFARECTSLMKAGKRHRDPSTAKQKYSRKSKDRKEAKSAPHDLGKTRRKKKSQYQEFTSATKTKSRGGWITEDPDPDYYCSSKSKSNYWRSPTTPNNRRVKVANGDYASSSYSSKKSRKLNYDESASNGSSRFYQPRYSASRFGSHSNSNSNSRMGRSYDWW